MSLNYSKLPVGLIVVISLVAAFSLYCADQVITVSGTSFTLTDTNKLTSKRAVKKAKANADSAIAAAASSAQKAEGDGKAFKVKLDNFTSKFDTYRKDTAANVVEVRTYLGDVNRHNEEVAQYTQLLTEHNQRIEAFNTLKPEDRNAATNQILTAETDKLRNWLQKLTYDTLALDVKTNVFMKEKVEFARRAHSLADEAAPLGAEVKTNLAVLDASFQQFQLCYDYAQQIDPLLTKYHVKPAPEDDARMSDYAKALGQMKALRGLIESNAIMLNLNF